MTRAEAISRFDALRGVLEVDADAPIASAHRAYIQVTEDEERPGPVREALAWIVHAAAPGATLWAAIDDGTGALLRVRRGRGGALASPPVPGPSPAPSRRAAP